MIASAVHIASLCSFPLPCAENYETSQNSMQKMMLSKMMGLSSDTSVATSTLLGYALIAKASDYEDVCQWKGVECENNAVARIIWNTSVRVYGKLDVDWIPSTSREVCMCWQNVQKLKTRLLPRELCILEMDECELCGEVDFEKLPERLQVLSLTQNKIMGTLSLSHLPPRIRTVDVRWNDFDTVLVRNSALPDSLEWVKVRQPFMVKKVVCVDAKKMDKRITIAKMS